jgi:hypothetical protein
MRPIPPALSSPAQDELSALLPSVFSPGPNSSHVPTPLPVRGALSCAPVAWHSSTWSPPEDGPTVQDDKAHRPDVYAWDAGRWCADPGVWEPKASAYEGGT